MPGMWSAGNQFFSDGLYQHAELICHAAELSWQNSLGGVSNMSFYFLLLLFKSFTVLQLVHFMFTNTLC